MILLIKAKLHEPFEAEKIIKFWCSDNDNFRAYFTKHLKGPFTKYSSIKYLDVSSIPYGIGVDDFGYTHFKSVL